VAYIPDIRCCLTNAMSANVSLSKQHMGQVLKKCVKMCSGSKHLFKSTRWYWSNEGSWYCFLLVSNLRCKFDTRH